MDKNNIEALSSIEIFSILKELIIGLHLNMSKTLNTTKLLIKETKDTEIAILKNSRFAWKHLKRSAELRSKLGIAIDVFESSSILDIIDDLESQFYAEKKAINETEIELMELKTELQKKCEEIKNTKLQINLNSSNDRIEALKDKIVKDLFESFSFKLLNEMNNSLLVISNKLNYLNGKIIKFKTHFKFREEKDCNQSNHLKEVNLFLTKLHNKPTHKLRICKSLMRRLDMSDKFDQLHREASSIDQIIFT